MKGRGSWLGSMQTWPYKHPYKFKEVVNIRTAGAASKHSAANKAATELFVFGRIV